VYVRNVTDGKQIGPSGGQPEDGEDPLSDGQRTIAGVLGASAAGAGGVATFVDGSNPGGAPLLLGIGALFLYLALTGQRLIRLEAGGAKAELARTRRALEEVVEDVIVDPDVPDQAKAEIAEDLKSANVSLSRSARRAVDSVLSARERALRYEKSVHSAIYRLRPDLNVMSPSDDAAPFDLVVSDGVRTVYVVLKWTSGDQFPLREVARVAERTQNNVAPVLLVVNKPPLLRPDGLPGAIGDRVILAVWGGQDDDSKLATVLDRLFPPT
jgi:hypothetical protein